MGLCQITAICSDFGSCSLKSEGVLPVLWTLIAEKIGTVAYKLQLPATSTVHPIFHVSQLKGAVPVSHSVELLPDSIDHLQVPLRILQKRMAKSGANVRLQALIHWIGLPPSLSVWEDMEQLRIGFHEHQLRDKLALIKGDVSNTPSASPEDNADGPRRRSLCQRVFKVQSSNRSTTLVAGRNAIK